MSKRQDLKGMRFGRLTVVELSTSRSSGGDRRWICLCDCGKETLVSTNSLNRENSKSCGCTNKRWPDETGNRYGKLLVISKGESHKSVNASKAYWICRCDCGKTKSIRGESLRSGKTTSCGCLQLESNKRRTMPNLEGARRRAIRFLKGNAKPRFLEWDLSDDEAISLMGKDCYYCGCHPSNISRSSSGNYFYSGIDRVDNTKGYVTGNVVPCCGQCNYSKSDLSVGDFLNWIKMVYLHAAKSSNDMF